MAGRASRLSEDLLAHPSPHLYWIATLLGGAPTSRFWHPWIALVFMAVLAWMLRAWLGDMRITANDRAWGTVVKRYI
jgi:formate dehydrogenase subunit gamma